MFHKKQASVSVGSIRAINSSIRNGDAHTGVIPYNYYFKCKILFTGGVCGAATLYDFFGYEVEDLLVLKNNKGNRR